MYAHVDAWGEAKRLTRRVRAVGIGVLIDIHGLPDGANGDAHSGMDGREARLWSASEAGDGGWTG